MPSDREVDGWDRSKQGRLTREGNSSSLFSASRHSGISHSSPPPSRRRPSRRPPPPRRRPSPASSSLRWRWAPRSPRDRFDSISARLTPRTVLVKVRQRSNPFDPFLRAVQSVWDLCVVTYVRASIREADLDDMYGRKTKKKIRPRILGAWWITQNDGCGFYLNKP